MSGGTEHEHHAGREIDAEAEHGPRQQAMHGGERGRLQHAEHAQVDEHHHAKEEPQPDEVQRLHGRPHPGVAGDEPADRRRRQEGGRHFGRRGRGSFRIEQDFGVTDLATEIGGAGHRCHREHRQHQHGADDAARRRIESPQLQSESQAAAAVRTMKNGAKTAASWWRSMTTFDASGRAPRISAVPHRPLKYRRQRHERDDAEQLEAHPSHALVLADERGGSACRWR